MPPPVYHSNPVSCFSVCKFFSAKPYRVVLTFRCVSTKKNSRTIQGEFSHLSSFDYFDTRLVFNDRFLLPESLFFSVSNILTHLKAKVKEGQILFLTFHISRSLCYGISKIEMCSKIANTAQTSALGYLPFFPQQTAHSATRGETKLKTLSPRCWRGDLHHRLKLSVKPTSLVVSRLT